MRLQKICGLPRLITCPKGSGDWKVVPVGYTIGGWCTGPIAREPTVVGERDAMVWVKCGNGKGAVFRTSRYQGSATADSSPTRSFLSKLSASKPCLLTRRLDAHSA